MTLSAVFCSIFNRLAWDGRYVATLCDVPVRIWVTIRSSDESSSEQYWLDIYENSGVRTNVDFPAASIWSILARVARNMLVSFTRGGIDGIRLPPADPSLLVIPSGARESSTDQCVHAALTVLLACGDVVGTDPANYRDWIYQHIAVDTPVDLLLLERDLALNNPLFLAGAGEDDEEAIRDLRHKRLLPPRPRELKRIDRSVVEYEVGTVFVHARYEYTAVIIDADNKCAESDQWITTMGVDSLPGGGRNQPFYRANCSDGSQRYVAQCNVRTDVITREHIVSLINAIPQVGRHFRSVDFARRKLLLGPDLRAFSGDDDKDDEAKTNV